MSEIMKLVSVIILSLLLATQTFSKWMLLLEYQVNKEYISQHLCVNKSRPMLHCHGKCQLAKKLVADENENKAGTSSHSFKTSLSEVLFVNPLPTFDQPVTASLFLKSYAHYLVREYDAPHAAVFRPPLLKNDI